LHGHPDALPASGGRLGRDGRRPAHQEAAKAEGDDKGECCDGRSVQYGMPSTGKVNTLLSLYRESEAGSARTSGEPDSEQE
jgi:hypothetical protein